LIKDECYGTRERTQDTASVGIHFGTYCCGLPIIGKLGFCSNVAQASKMKIHGVKKCSSRFICNTVVDEK